MMAVEKFPVSFGFAGALLGAAIGSAATWYQLSVSGENMRYQFTLEKCGDYESAFLFLQLAFEKPIMGFAERSVRPLPIPSYQEAEDQSLYEINDEDVLTPLSLVEIKQSLSRTKRPEYLRAVEEAIETTMGLAGVSDESLEVVSNAANQLIVLKGAIQLIHQLEQWEAEKPEDFSVAKLETEIARAYSSLNSAERDVADELNLLYSRCRQVTNNDLREML